MTPDLSNQGVEWIGLLHPHSHALTFTLLLRMQLALPLLEIEAWYVYFKKAYFCSGAELKDLLQSCSHDREGCLLAQPDPKGLGPLMKKHPDSIHSLATCLRGHL